MTVPENRTPELPIYRGLPGEPTGPEVVAAEVWLGKHGAPVSVPTRLLAIRLGARHIRFPGGAGQFYLYYGISMVALIAYMFLESLPRVRDEEMTGSSLTYFIIFGFVAAFRLGVRGRERNLPGGARPSSVMRLVGGWYFASVAITFGGGAALGIAMYVTTPARTYALSWLALLALSAVLVTVLLTDVLRRRVIAEDDASVLVDKVVRIHDAYGLMPAAFAVPVLTDLITSHHPPSGFTVWLLVYAALAVATHVVGELTYRRRYRTLPPGYYGAPVRQRSTPSDVDWAPPAATSE